MNIVGYSHSTDRRSLMTWDTALTAAMVRSVADPEELERSTALPVMRRMLWRGRRCGTSVAGTLNRFANSSWQVQALQDDAMVRSLSRGWWDLQRGWC